MGRIVRRTATIILASSIILTTQTTKAGFWDSVKSNEVEGTKSVVSGSSNGKDSGEDPVHYGVDVVSL